MSIPVRSEYVFLYVSKKFRVNQSHVFPFFSAPILAHSPLSRPNHPPHSTKHRHPSLLCFLNMVLKITTTRSPLASVSSSGVGTPLPPTPRPFSPPLRNHMHPLCIHTRLLHKIVSIHFLIGVMASHTCRSFRFSPYLHEPNPLPPSPSPFPLPPFLSFFLSFLRLCARHHPSLSSPGRPTPSPSSHDHFLTSTV